MSRYLVVCSQRCDQLVYEEDTIDDAEKRQRELESWGYLVRIVDTESPMSDATKRLLRGYLE